ncbi:TPA: EpsG family protein [Vibrio vulnificus]
MIYGFVFVLLFSFCVYEVAIINDSTNNSAYRRKLFINYLSIVILCFFVFGRYKTGTDWPTYYEYFYYNTFFWEYGWSIYNDFLFKQGFEPESLILSVAFTSILLKLYTAKKLNLPISTFIFIILPFVVNRDFGTIRQGLAISFTFLSFLFLTRNKYLPFLILCVVASLFHQSAIIFLVSIFFALFRFDLTKKLLILVLAVSFILGVLGVVEKIFEFIVYSLGFDSGVFYKLKRYLTYTDEYTSSGFPIIPVLKKIITVIIFYICGSLSERHKRDSVFSLAFKLYVLGVCLFIALSDFSQLRRLVGYFEIYEYVCASILIISVRKTELKVFLLLYMALSMSAKMNTYINSYSDYLIPYRSIIDYAI